MKERLREWVSRLWGTVRPHRLDRELEEELRQHLEFAAEDARRRGHVSETDVRATRLRAGGTTQAMDAVRAQRGIPAVESVLRDVRHGLRQFARNRSFTIVTLLTLTICIGSTSAIFSLLSAVALRALPVADPQDLYIVQAEPNQRRFSYPAVERVVNLLDGRAEVAAQSSIERALIATRGGAIGDSPAEPARLQLVLGDFFEALRQRPQIGRLLSSDDNRSLGEHPVVVISDRYWTRRFGRATNVLDSTLIVNGVSMAIVGVAAPQFFGASVDRETPDAWAPAAMQATLRFAGGYGRSGGDLRKPWALQPQIGWLEVMIRAPAGVAPAAAEAMTLALHYESPLARPEPDVSIPVRLLPGSRGFSALRSELTNPLVVLLFAVGLLLALACANIASLLLARATSREREMAIRLSMGAGRGRLIRQLLTESLLLASIGGALGLLLAHGSSTWLLTVLTPGEPGGIDVRPDWRVVSLTAVMSMATALAFGLLPAVRSTRVPLSDTLRAHARSVVGAGRRGRVPIGKALIAGQMTIAVVLLIAATLFLRSLQALTQVDVGYDREAVLVARIDPQPSGYTVSDLPALYTRVFENLTRLPGVLGVSASTTLFSGRNRGDFAVEGYAPGPDEQMSTLKEWVTSEYFRTVGLAITQGREFGPEDSASGRRVSVINETMARRYFRDRNPIGHRLSWGAPSGVGHDTFEIVGVVEDARYANVRDESVNMAYLLVVQSDRFAENVLVRVSGDPAALMNAVPRALREAEPRLAIGTIETLESRIARSMGVERLLGWLTMAFSAAALGLACLGLYGTISFAVRIRTAELGLRMAFGATGRDVQWLILREALALVFVGGGLGLLLAFVSGRLIEQLLYGVAPSDPLSYGAAAGVLVAASALAAYVPAWRASRLDPLVALRHE